LRENDIGSFSGIDLSNALKENCSLLSLCLPPNIIDVQALHSALKNKPTLVFFVPECYLSFNAQISLNIINDISYLEWNSPCHYFAKNIEQIIIRKGVTSINDAGFFDFVNLVSFTVEEENSSFASQNGVLFSKDFKTLIHYPSGCSFKNYSVPNSVTSIGVCAFSYCSSLSKITLPDSLTSIGRYAFYKCTSLTDIEIPNSVNSIGNGAFSSCTSLKTFIFPNSITSIEAHASYDCCSLTSVNIPHSFALNGKCSLNRSCSSLSSIKHPYSITSIGNNTFESCSSLTSISFPNSILSIGNSAFKDCLSLTSISLPNSVLEIGNYAFSGCILLPFIIRPKYCICPNAFINGPKVREIYIRK